MLFVASDHAAMVVVSMEPDSCCLVGRTRNGATCWLPKSVRRDVRVGDWWFGLTDYWQNNSPPINRR